MTATAKKASAKPATANEATAKEAAVNKSAARTATPKKAGAQPTTTKEAAAKPMFEKVAFTMFEVTEPARARAFYEDVLGLTRGLASPEGTWTEYDLPGGGCLALFKHPRQDVARGGGGAAIAFEVADLDALVARLAAAGVSILGDLIRGPRCRMANLLDTEGNAILLHELDGKR